jgi:hydroxymethylbilane synthase
MSSAPAARARPSGPLRLGTRGSPLALAQARMVAEALGGPAAATIVTVQTMGDRVQDRPLREIGGKALWTRELDRALLDGDVDLAVHSMKDVETLLADGVALAAVLPRADPRDCLVGAAGLGALPAGATVGTSSPRRAAQLLHRRPDLSIVPLRGNVGTRLARVAGGEPMATFLAAAGLARLGMAAGVPLDLDEWLPAAGQGVIGITARAGDAETLARLAALDHAETRACLSAERALLARLGGSCHSAVAAHAAIDAGGRLRLRAELYSPCGRDMAKSAVTGDAAQPAQLGEALADALLATATPAIRASLAPRP